MPERVDLYDSAYSHFDDPVAREVREAAFGVDIGQNSWVTVEEYDRFIPWLELSAGRHVLEIASGSGGPAIHLARRSGCRVTGIDANGAGVATATRLAERAGEAGRVRFAVADATMPLPFEEGVFDALLCMDSMNHLPNRLDVLREWRRVLRDGRRALFTDPVVVTGPVTGDELALRGSVGRFLFVPDGTNEALIERAGFALVRKDDVTDNAGRVSGRWLEAREAHRASLVETEGDTRFDGLQRFFQAVHRLSTERRLSRIAYLIEKRAP